MYKQCILFLLVGLMVGGPLTNARSCSKSKDPSDIPSPATYEGARPSTEQTEDAFSSPNASETVDDNGLLERMIIKKIELKKELAELRLLTLILGETANTMPYANLNETDVELPKEMLYERERLREAVTRFDLIRGTCKREIKSAQDDILSSKNIIDEYLKQQQNPEEELQK